MATISTKIVHNHCLNAFRISHFMVKDAAGNDYKSMQNVSSKKSNDMDGSVLWLFGWKGPVCTWLAMLITGSSRWVTVPWRCEPELTFQSIIKGDNDL